jgi:hypothetical protein
VNVTKTHGFTLVIGPPCQPPGVATEATQQRRSATHVQQQRLQPCNSQKIKSYYSLAGDASFVIDIAQRIAAQTLCVKKSRDRLAADCGACVPRRVAEAAAWLERK